VYCNGMILFQPAVFVLFR